MYEFLSIFLYSYYIAQNKKSQAFYLYFYIYFNHNFYTYFNYDLQEYRNIYFNYYLFMYFDTKKNTYTKV